LKFAYPPRTELVEQDRKDEKNILGTSLEFSSQLSKEAIVDFYRNLFISQGFKEDKEIASLPDLALVNEKDIMFIFTKGALTTVVLNVYYRDEKKELNYYVLNSVEVKYLLDLSSQNLGKPQKLKGVPVNFQTKELYPSKEEPQGKEATYMYLASSKLRDSIDFYKKQMPFFGWKLIDEEPREGRFNLLTATSRTKDLAQVSQSPEKLFPGADVNVEGITLTFQKQNKQCVVIINQLKDSAEVLRQNKIVNPDYSKKQGDILISVFYDK